MKAEQLGGDPRPRGARKLEGGAGELRVRVGDYRIVYEVDDEALRVLVLRVAHRREVYRRGR
jgi:mRNA interferase RelE/StbE